MKNIFTRKNYFLSIIAVALLAVGSYANAACDVILPSKRTNIDILSNSFPSINFLAERMEACSEGTLNVRAKLTTEHLELKKLALSSRGRASYQIIQLANSQFLEYVQRGWLSPITSYVVKYRDAYNFRDIPQSMWDAVTYEGHIYAIPVQQNLQHFFYREDLLAKHNIDVPTNYDEVIAAADKLQRAGIEHPISQAFGRGWNLATEFTNIYVSLGGEFFDDNRRPVFQNDGAGKEAIEIMARMLPYMSPNALSLGTDDVMVAFQQGDAALGNVWASRAANMDDEEVSRVVGDVAFAAAPAAKAGRIPSSTGWWDGYAIPSNVPKSQRELAFQIIAEGTNEKAMRDAGGLAFFSREAITTEPGLVEKYRYWPALLDTAVKGAPAFPGSPYFNIAHTALGTAVADALAGDLNVQAALNRAANEYTKEAGAKGLL